ncbi:hypothetical protein N8I77_002607 [Diaporthe amygdali]|uniref:Prion-inhibition and propagation HeLo domain-containing protein n=1 Tax=Phomopsis amygdali TaxID=1214568 RepID=A0AAD9SUB7_PHOAM|nr:hypothetical protein N8I77_002607 [Diaporthe amygdali]
MAEAAGLAIGAVALVSLFQTAIELLEYFEAGRGLASDSELAATKLSLLEARLRQWGDDLQVEYPGQEDGGLRTRWADEGGLVTRSLEGISEILGNASQLSEKYGLHKKRRLVWHSNIPLLYPILHRADIPISSPRKSSRISPSIRRQAVWAIKDKKRFESLISDLDFFITNLEKVSGRLLKLDCADCDGLAQSNNSPESTMASNTPNDFMRSLTGDRHRRQGYSGATQTTSTSSDTSTKSASVARPETHHHFVNVNASGEAFQPLGDIDSESNYKHKYQHIDAKDSAFQPCGNSKSPGLIDLLKQHQEGFKNRPTTQHSHGNRRQ